MNTRRIGVAMDYGVDCLAKTVPGWREGNTTLDRLDSDIAVYGVPDPVMLELYLQIEEPGCPYIPSVFDCENFSRWYASQVAELWARLVWAGKAPNGCLHHGAVMGKLPVGDLPAGSHCANFFFNDEGRYRMFEPQERRLLTPEEVARTEQVWKLEYH